MPLAPFCNSLPLKTFKLFCFQIFCISPYMMKVIPQTRPEHWIWYLRFYYIEWFYYPSNNNIFVSGHVYVWCRNCLFFLEFSIISFETVPKMWYCFVFFHFICIFEGLIVWWLNLHLLWLVPCNLQWLLWFFPASKADHQDITAREVKHNGKRSVHFDRM